MGRKVNLGALALLSVVGQINHSRITTVDLDHHRTERDRPISTDRRMKVSHPITQRPDERRQSEYRSLVNLLLPSSTKLIRRWLQMDKHLRFFGFRHHRPPFRNSLTVIPFFLAKYFKSLR